LPRINGSTVPIRYTAIQPHTGCTLASRWCTAFVATLLVLAFAAIATPARAQTSETPAAGAVYLSDIKGAIGVATLRQITRAITQSRTHRAQALIIQLDTPGGLVSSTRDIIKEMIASQVPIIVYVAPSGARAASAGTFIVYASNVAAMAPGTNIGAATPIQMGGLPGMPNQKDGDKNKPATDDAAKQKAVNDVVAMLRSLAQLRGRDVDFAEKAVREAATLTASEALKQGVIEIVAASIPDLLAQADGRKVTSDGIERTLVTKGKTPIVIEPDLRTRLLGAIADPNIAFILLLIGFYGIVLEFWNPGTFVAGTVGGISLILALTALSALPVHYGALALLVLGIALMIGEVLTPGIGILGIGGVIAFLAGSYFLFEGADADIEFAVSPTLIIGATATTAALVFGVVGAAMTARRRKPATGSEEMIGSQARVVSWQAAHGQVHIHGEIWAARSGVPLKPDDAVRVVGRDGLTLIVEP
jgi:membrane-bound serine protease (ClpP class)